MPWALARMVRYVQKVKFLQELKENDDICAQALERGSYLLFCKGKPLLQSGAKLFRNVISWRSYQEVKAYNPDVKKASIVLDVNEVTDELTPLFACSVPPEKKEDVQVKFNGHFTDMRKALFTLPNAEHLLVTRGYSLVTWDENVKFCSYCGSRLNKKISGCSKECPKCDSLKQTHYPAIHPVAIVRVTNDANDKILLVRKPQSPKGMYSCVAGFLEPGEILDMNIRREIAEEAGIVVENVQYFQSEAWPLPQATLMLACTAVAMPGSDKIELDKNELEDGRWFTKGEVQAALTRVQANPLAQRDNEEGHLLVPPRGAIAHQLIKHWLDQYMPARL